MKDRKVAFVEIVSDPELKAREADVTKGVNELYPGCQITRAAIYARKSTDQNVTDEEKSVSRQIDLAIACATKHGFESCRTISMWMTQSRDPSSTAGRLSCGCSMP